MSLFGSVLIAALTAFGPSSQSSSVLACTQPDNWSVAAAFDLAANGTAITDQPAAITVPPSLLKAIGWVESGWRQFRSSDAPLLSPDFGYGIMQITSGMAGAFGELNGQIAPQVQSRIASEYRFNVAYGARILADKWANTPAIGNRQPPVVEDWYYAVWAYNGWGWVNNPNNPRFSRQGTAATDPATWPYQDRVYYLVAHPPHDSHGNPLWKPVHVWMPSRAEIGTQAHSYSPAAEHLQAPAAVSAVYLPGALRPAAPGSGQSVLVKVINTGTQPWVAVGDNAVQLTYHVFSASGSPWRPITPFATGVLAFGQHPVPLAGDVLPGKTVTFTTAVQAPAQPGRYRIVWDLEQGASTWFSQLHAPAHVVSMRVTSVPPTPSAVFTPTPTPQPEGNLKYLADTSIPDGSTLRAGMSFTKGWLVFDDGTAPWDSGWKLVHISGKAMGAPRIALPATKACHSANVVASMVAPSHRGSYTSAWQLQDPLGDMVGQKLTVTIRVIGSNPHPPPTPMPTSTPVRRHPTPTPTVTPVGLK